MRRFRDPRRTVYDFVGDVLVCCPRCGRVAHVTPVPGHDYGPHYRYMPPRRLVCGSCGLTRTTDKRWAAFPRGTVTQATDPYFDLPLRLQIATRHGWLWAYNLEHLDLIRRYVQAPLRERAPWYDHGQKMTLTARLPRWIKTAKHRDEMLRAVDRLRASLVDGGA